MFCGYVHFMKTCELDLLCKVHEHRVSNFQSINLRNEDEDEDEDNILK